MQRIRKWTRNWLTRTRKYRRAWRVSTFITGVVISSSVAQYEIVGSLMTFLTDDPLGKPLVIAAAIINMKEGFTSFMAIIGSFIADAYLSRYFVGLFIFMLEYSPLFYVALVVIAMGEGGLEHTLRKFGSDQFEEHIRDKYIAKPHSIAWWYMGSLIGFVPGMCMGSLIGSNMLMLVAFLVLVLGTLFYYRDMPVGSPFTYMLHVVVAMAEKRHQDLPVDDTLIHGGIANMSDDGGMEKHDVDGNPEENCGVEKDEEIKGGLIDDEQLRTWFDKQEAKEESKWRVCTQTEIEETKLFLHLFPIWATFIMYGMVLSMGKTFFIEQATTLDANLSGSRFQIPSLSTVL